MSDVVHDRAARTGATAAAAAFAGALAVFAAVLLTGPAAPFGGALEIDRLAAVMLLLITGVAAVVLAYARRSLSGDPRQRRFVLAAGATTAATATMVCAGTLSVLVGAWLATGAGLLVLLGQRRDLPAARVGLRRAGAAFLVGDLALVAAATIVWSTVGDLRVDELGAGAARLGDTTLGLAGLSLPAGTVVACLLVVAAMGRSALVPLHRWLPATLAAPTPVSALLHAGLVNAGGFLLVRCSPLFSASATATTAAFLLGAGTAVYATALMRAKPDAKGALAHSTMGQMGFMVMACALGASGAAVLHLVAHGLYKATLFLGADSVVRRSKRARTVARPAPAGVAWPVAARVAAAVLVPGAALAATLATVAQGTLDHPGAPVLLACAWTTAAALGWHWLARTPGRAGTGLAALAAATAAYAALVTGADALLAPALAEPVAPATPWLALAPAAALVLWRLAGDRLRSALYVHALDGGVVAAAPTPPRRTGRTSDRVLFPIPSTNPRSATS